VRLAHITDPHLTSLEAVRPRDLRGKQWLGYLSWRRRRRFLHQRTRLDALVASLQAAQPDLVCVTGDLVHIGLEAEIHAAGAWLASLGPPGRVIVVPGNHDLYGPKAWPIVSEVWKDYLHLHGGAMSEDPHAGYPLREAVPGIPVMCANSSLPMPWYSAAGRLGVLQRRALGTLLQTGREAFPRILLLHHPPEPASASVGVSWRKALADAREMATAFQQADIILHGHLHRNDARVYGRARVYTTASASAEDASYRLFDLDWVGSDAQPHWRVRMTLHQLFHDAVRCVEESTWTITDA